MDVFLNGPMEPLREAGQARDLQKLPAENNTIIN
jgi:hypothetical protein